MNNSFINDFNSTTRKYYNDIKKYQTITIEEERDLIRKAKENNIIARNKLITSNLKFVINVAKQFRGRGVAMQDLISEGNLGLLKAIDKFDESKDVKFISYAVWWIKCYIQKFITEDKLRESHEISTDELCEIYKSKGIDDPEDERILKRETVMSNENDILQQEHNEEESLFINRIMSKLTPKEQKIIQMYFGLNSGKFMKLEEIAKEMSLSAERCRQIKYKGLIKLKSEALAFS